MKVGNSFQNSQLEAIHRFYDRLLERNGKKVSMAEAIITWFAEGHAEKFREEYIKQQLMLLH